MENTEAHDQEISCLFEDAKSKLEKIENSSKHQKKQVVKDLAKSLEQKIPTDTICLEITNQLRGQVSESFIRQCLDEKYKQKPRVENARKQNKEQNPDEHKGDGEKLASLPTLTEEDQNDKIILVETNGQILVQTDRDDNDNDRSLLNKEDPPGNNNEIEKDPSNLHTQKEQQKLEKHFGNLKIKECPSCIELHSQNAQLKEALKKLNPITTADIAKSAHSDKENTEITILNFEFFKTYREVSNYAKPFFYKGNNSEIWFHGKINTSTGKVISSGFGRTSELQGSDVEIDEK